MLDRSKQLSISALFNIQLFAETYSEVYYHIFLFRKKYFY